MHTTRCRGAGTILQFRCSTVRRRGGSPNSNAHPPAAEGQGSFSNSVAPPFPMHTACPLPRGRGHFPIPIPMLHRSLPRGQPDSDAHHPLPRGRGHSPSPMLHRSPPRASPSSNAHCLPAAEGQGPFSKSDAPPLATEGQPDSDAHHPLPRGRGHSPSPMLHRSPPRASPSSNAHCLPAAEGQGPFSKSDAPPLAAEGQP